MQKSKIILTLFLLFVVRNFWAQVTISIPAGTVNAIPTTTVSMSGSLQTQHRKPLGTYFGYERTALRFKQSQIGMLGQITAIAVFCDSIYNPGNTPLNIYVKEISDSAFTAVSTIATETTGATLVYTGTLTASSFIKNTWINIPFTTYFTHATSKPLEFIFETNAGGTGSDPINGKFFAHNNSTNSSYYTTQFWNSDNNPPTTTGTLSYYRPNVQITINALSPCSGAPNAGTTLSTADTLCLNESLTLSLQGNTSATALTYQWQQSWDGITYFNVNSATSDVLVTTLAATSWYQCAVTCSGQTSYSAPKKIEQRNFMQCYCTNLGGDCSGGTAIDSVAIEGTGLANGLTGCSPTFYTAYPSSGNTTAILNRASSYVLDTRFNGNVVACFWIDFNRNGVLENSEFKQICTQSPIIDSLFQTTFNVPASADIGLTLMRVRSRAIGNANDTLTVCSPFGSGETEDYYVYIDYQMGIEQLKTQGTRFKFYPNPANEVLTIEVNSPYNSLLDLTILDVLGNEIKKSTIETNQFSVDISSLQNGVYFIKIGNSAQKFIKQ
jgi:hypothetical protein